jgi:predicted nucleotidyltransferase
VNYREKYLKRAKRAATYLRWCPFLRLAGLNGSIVRGEQSQKSDIDFLIIAKAGRLYTARFFATFLVALTGYRRHGKKIAGRICLNCYLNDKNPDISPKNPSSNEKVASAYKYLIPLTDENVAAERFFQINTWMNKFTVSGKTYSTNL